MDPNLPEMESILYRLDRLEKRNKTLKQVLALIMLIACCLIFPAFHHRGRTINARKIVLKDATGTTRAILGMRSAGPGLTLYDSSGNLAALLTVVQTGPVLSLYDTKGTTRVLLGVTPKGATLAFKDPSGKLRTEMGYSADAPHITFFDPKGKAIYMAR